MYIYIYIYIQTYVILGNSIETYIYIHMYKDIGSPPMSEALFRRIFGATVSARWVIPGRSQLASAIAR